MTHFLKNISDYGNKIWHQNRPNPEPSSKTCLVDGKQRV